MRKTLSASVSFLGARGEAGTGGAGVAEAACGLADGFDSAVAMHFSVAVVQGRE
jgi:hypothetical protein